MINHFERSEEIRRLVKLEHLGMTEAHKRLLTNQVAALIIIPEGFSKDLEVGKNTPVEVIGNPARPLQAELVRLLMQSGADYITAAQSGVNTIYLYMQQAGVSAEELEQVFKQSVLQFTLQSLARGELFATRTVSAFEGLTTREYYAVTVSILFVLVSGLLATRNRLGEGRLLWQRILATDLSFSQLVLARWISLSLLLAVPYFLYYSAIVLFIPDLVRGELGWFLLVSCFVLAAVSALYIMLSFLVDDLAKLNLLGFLVISLMTLLGGSLIPLAYLPAEVEQLAYLSLNKWAAMGIFTALFAGERAMLWQSLIALGLGSLLLLALSIWLGKRRLDRDV